MISAGVVCAPIVGVLCVYVGGAVMMMVLLASAL